MTKFSNEQRESILAEAREILERPVERYTPPPRAEPLLYRKTTRYYERPEPPKLDTRQQQPPPEPEPDWSGWETWVSARIADALAAERAVMVKIVGTALGDSLKAEREASQRELSVQLRELKLENAKMQHALQHLGELIQLEKNRTIDLPALPARRDFN